MQNKLELLRIFCHAAESDTFKEAAGMLGISPQAITRAVQELEALQGEVLFHRNTRRMQLTNFGEELVARVRPLIEQVDDVFTPRDTQDGDDFHGTVTIAAPMAFGQNVVSPVLSQILKAYPGIRVNLRLSDQHADVVKERIDIGLRIGVIRDNRFIARQLGTIQYYVVATPELIAEKGVPKAPRNLAQFPTSGVLDVSTGREWPWFFKDRQELPIHCSRMMFDDAIAESHAVCAGLAFGQLPSFLADKPLAQGKLQRVLEAFEPDPWTYYIYRPQRGPVPRRVRAMYDALSEGIPEYLERQRHPGE